MLGKGDGFDEIQVAAKPGVSPQQLKTQLARALGPTVDVRTGQEQADKESKDIRDNLGFLKTFLLAFAFIALFVGAFLIFNTFSITVAQRMREFALLRTLGASRRQIWRAVVTEGLAAGLRRRRRRLPAGHRDGGAAARAVQGVRRRPAEQGRRHREPHGDRHGPRGHGGEPRRQHRAGGARHARAAGGGPARGRRADAARARAADGHRRRGAARDRRGAHVRRALRQPEVRQRRDLVHGRRRRADLPRRRAALAAAGAAAGERHRAPDRARDRHHRPARTRELGPPAGAHRGHRRGAHDRRGARHLRLDLRGRGEGDHQRRHRQEPQERLRGAEHRRLLAVLARGADAASTASRASRASAACASPRPRSAA